jgi:hypothetical protein
MTSKMLFLHQTVAALAPMLTRVADPAPAVTTVPGPWS